MSGSSMTFTYLNQNGRGEILYEQPSPRKLQKAPVECSEKAGALRDCTDNPPCVWFVFGNFYNRKYNLHDV